MNDTLGSQMGGLTLSMEGYGNDYFLYWMVNCVGYNGYSNPFFFATESIARNQNNIDQCKLRFKTTTESKMYALNQIDQPPGLEVYSSCKILLIHCLSYSLFTKQYFYVIISNL